MSEDIVEIKVSEIVSNCHILDVILTAIVTELGYISSGYIS